MLIMDKTRANLLVRNVKLYAYHHATSANIHYMTVLLLHFLELTDKIVAHFVRILHKLLLLHNIENGKGSCTSQMITTECGSEHAVYRLKLRRYEHGTHRESIANALGTCYDVGTDAKPLMGKELTATTVTTLYLVADEHGTIFLASSLQALGKLLSSQAYATNTLYALYDAGSHIALGKFGLPCFEIVKRKEGNVVVGIDWRNNLRIVGSLNRQ